MYCVCGGMLYVCLYITEFMRGCVSLVLSTEILDLATEAYYNWPGNIYAILWSSYASVGRFFFLWFCVGVCVLFSQKIHFDCKRVLSGVISVHICTLDNGVHMYMSA